MRFRQVLGALFFGLLAVSSAQAQQSKSALTTSINTDFADNNSGAITPALLRSITDNIVLSYVDWLTCTSSQGFPYWTLSTWGCVTVGNGLSVSGSALGISSPVSVANGGLGLTSGTSGGVLGFTGTGTIASSGALTANALILGGGAGALPAPLGSLGTTSTVLHGNAGGAPTYGAVTLTTDVTGILPVANGGTGKSAYATASNFQAQTAATPLSTDSVWNAAALTALTNATTIAVDFSTGFNFSVTLASNNTLGAPSNAKVGQTGCFFLLQDGTGSRTLAYNAVYKFAGGTAPVLSTAANALDVLCYQVETTSFILASLTKDVR